MALEWYDSGGDFLTDAQMTSLGKWDVFTSQVFINATGGTDGLAAIDSAPAAYGSPRTVKKVTLVPNNEVIFGWWHAPLTLPLGSPGTYFVVAAIHNSGGGTSFSGSTKQLSLNIDYTGHLYVARGDYTGTVLGTATNAVPANKWLLIEVKFIVHGSAGYAQIVVNDAVMLTISAGNTQALGSSVVDAVEYIPWKIDSPYIMSTTPRTDNPYVTFFGKRWHVLANRMRAAALTQWTPPSGYSNLQAINGTTPDGNKSKTSVVGNTDLYDPTSLPLEVDQVIAVQSNLVARKIGSTYTGHLADVAEIAGTPYEAPYHDVAITDKDYLLMRAVAPDDGAQWTRTKYNASRRGFRRVA